MLCGMVRAGSVPSTQEEVCTWSLSFCCFKLMHTVVMLEAHYCDATTHTPVCDLCQLERGIVVAVLQQLLH